MEGIVLSGGNVNGAVVRIGDTVRRNVGTHSPSVHLLLQHLEKVGFEAAPRFLGIDDQGREVLSWIEGHVVGPDDLATVGDVRRVGRLLRETHDATASFTSPPDAAWWRLAPDPSPDERIIHGDFAPWNLIVGGTVWSVIDWDSAQPGRVEWDLAYAIHTTAYLWPSPPPWDREQLALTDIVRRLHAFAEGYGAADDVIARSVGLVPERCDAILTMIREEAANGVGAFHQMLVEGHDTVWADARDYTKRLLPELTASLSGR